MMNDIMICQSIVRRRSAIQKLKVLISAHFIEQQWISFLDGKDLTEIKPHVSFIKTIPGAWMALNDIAASKISTVWRRYHCMAVYSRILKGTIRMFM